MKVILFLKPYLEPKIWGSNNLKSFNIKIPKNQKIGEAWVISGYNQKSSIITSEPYSGMTLCDLYREHRDLFADCHSPQYPLLVKLLDCNDDLSVQVHPNDMFAKKNYHANGKNECWYILKARVNANIIYGHNAKSMKEFKTLIDNNQWNLLLKTKLVKKDDFIYVNAKTIHALNAGLLVYELQQASDLTLRLYDYDRLENGSTRTLHVKEALENISIPFTQPNNTITNAHGNFLVDNEYFSLVKIINTDKKNYKFKALWLQITIIDGKGKVDDIPIKKGTSFLILNGKSFTFEGNLKALVSYIKEV